MPGAARTDSVEVSRNVMELAKNERRVMEAKVNKVREVVQNFSKEEIVLVLQHYELDVEKTIQAFCEDGAKDALDTWSGGKSQSANARKKQRQKANKKAAAATAPNGHDVLSNGASTGPSPIPPSIPASSHPLSAAPPPIQPPKQQRPPKTNPPVPPAEPMGRAGPAQPPLLNGSAVGVRGAVPNGTGSTPLYAPPERARTISSSSMADAASKKKALEKEVKLMSRHDAQMLRVKERFNQEVQRAEDRLRRAFQEMRDKLAAREAELSAELGSVKVDGQRLIYEKEVYGRGLHARAERAPTLSDKELDDLRHDVKAFTSDRRLEEEFASTLRFSYEPDALSALIAHFGCVTPVKPMEKGHHSSHSSVAGSLDTDSGLGHSLSPMSPEKKSTTVEINGISMRSTSLTEEQLEEINRKLQESLLSQGISTNVMELVSGSSGAVPVVRRAARGGRGGRGGAESGRGRGGPSTRPTRGRPAPQLTILE